MSIMRAIEYTRAVKHQNKLKARKIVIENIVAGLDALNALKALSNSMFKEELNIEQLKQMHNNLTAMLQVQVEEGLYGI